MKRYLYLFFFFGFLLNISAQNKNAINSNSSKDMNIEILKKIELERFNNRIGLEIGMAIVNFAKGRNQKIAVQVERINHTIFLYVDDGLPADKHNWIRRKANVSKHFEQSSLSVKNDLINGNMTLKETFTLDDSEYLARGGSIPIFVKNAGMVAVVTVSGLHDEEDHRIIIEALKGTYIN